MSAEKPAVQSRGSNLPGVSVHARSARDQDSGAARFAQLVSESLALTRVARASAVAFTLIITTFFLLSSFTFSWLNIVRNENVLWIPKLVHSFTYLYWTVLLLNAATLLPAFYRRQSRLWTEAFLLVLTVIGMLITRVYSLYDVPLSSTNLFWSVVITFPLACFGIHDLAMFSHKGLWEQQSHAKNLPLRSAFACGGLVGAWYFLIALLRYPVLSVHAGPVLPVLLNTVLLHACIFTAVAALLSLIGQSQISQGITSLTKSRVRPRLQLIISLGFFWVLSSLLLRHLVTPALSFNNAWASAWSWSYPLCFVGMLAGWHVRRAALRQEAISGWAEEVLSGLVPESRRWTAGIFAAALLAAFAVPYAIEQVDWNFLFQRLTAVVIWVAAFTAAWRVFARFAPARVSVKKDLAWLLVAAACCFGLAQTNRLWRSFGLKEISQAGAAYNGMDASFQVAQIAFRPVIRDDDTTGLFSYLHRNALIADPIRPPKLKLVESLTPATGPRPNIYIIVVDTLRRDYLSPYNPRVTFTPRIAAFAKESFVFQHAYTNYGGTALSEPAIWAGMMMPSKHYVEPFAEMNALEQLTTADGYHRLFTPDQILRGLLTKLPADTLLNVRGNQYPGLDLRDAVHQINSQPPSAGPQFVYTQPQNLHPITLNQLAASGQKVEGRYPGFHPRYAEELRKVDEAFGQLIDALKAKGTFENSIVIFTSDHGDWLGEYGRWGHGQSLLPPIIEVPLLIHLPENLAKKVYCDTSQTVFLTDITPSIYYLLGHRALRHGEFYGRPLFTETAAEQKDYTQRYHFFMSSYAAVFAVLEQDTQTFYVADAVDENQSLYHLSDDWYGLDNIIDRKSQPKFEGLTRGYIERLNTLYNYTPAQR